MTTQDQSAPAPLPPIAHDIDCIKCGYNLRGLVVSGTCPECGAPVAPSADPQRRAERHLRWVRKLKIGLTLFLACKTASLLATLIFMCLTLNQWMTGADSGVSFTASIVMCLFQLFEPLWLIAVWLLTTSDPTVFGVEHRRTNLTTRWCIYGLGLAYVIVNILLSLLGVRVPTDRVFASFVWSSTGVGLGLGIDALTIQHLRRLARRAAASHLVRYLGIALWLILGKAILSLVLNSIAINPANSSANEQIINLGLRLLSASVGVFTLVGIIRLCICIDRAEKSLVMMNTTPPA